MQVKLYEDIARFGHIATTYAYPVKVNGPLRNGPVARIPKFDNPKMDMMPALQLFGAGREKRIYAVPPFTRVESLDFDDHPFTVQQWMSHAPSADRPTAILMKWCWMTPETACLSAPIPILPPTERGEKPMNKPLLSVNNLTHLYAPGKGFSDVSFDLWPGEVLGIVGESGSGKTTLLKSISARLTPQQGGDSLREPFAVCNERGRPPSPAAHRMGRSASASTRRPAPSGLGRRQYRRAADGDRGASLRRHSRHRAEVAGRGGNSRQPDRRPATTFPAACSNVCRLPATW